MPGIDMAAAMGKAALRERACPPRRPGMQQRSFSGVHWFYRRRVGFAKPAPAPVPARPLSARDEEIALLLQKTLDAVKQGKAVIMILLSVSMRMPKWPSIRLVK